MVLAIIDSFYDDINKDKLCAKVTKIVFENNSLPCITQYNLSTTDSFDYLISAIKIVTPIEIDDLYISISKYGLDYEIGDKLRECGYNIIPLEVIKENQLR